MTHTLGSTVKTRRTSKEGLVAEYPHIPGLKRLDLFSAGDLTKVILNPQFEQAIADFLHIVITVELRDVQALTFGLQRAQQIINDRSSIRTLMDKAYLSSSAARKLPLVVTRGYLLNVMRLTPENPVDTNILMRAYEDYYGRRLSRASIQLAMRSLVETGNVRVEKQRTRDSLKNTANFYSLV